MLLEVNTRTFLTRIARTLGRAATLDDVPDDLIDEWSGICLDWIWLLGVWQTGADGRRVSRSREDWLAGYRHLLPDFQVSDVCGSCFAVVAFSVSTEFGGDPALARFRERLRRRGLRLMLDFVPNHTAIDHPWVNAHPEFYIAGSREDREKEPQNYCEVPDGRILAHGRDPYFPGWPDSLQLDYTQPGVQAAMREELTAVAERCDGVRCDMAMLLLPEVFQRTWGRMPPPFWPSAIRTVRDRHPAFVFAAEVYWGLEWELQQQGFDYTYDKTLYDRLRGGDAAGVREHLAAPMEYQARTVRFLENHDESRAAAVFPPEMHRAAAAIALLAPGLHLLHDGQREGCRIPASVHLCRSADEPPDASLRSHYDRLLQVAREARGRDAAWTLLECSPAWEGNWTWHSFVCFCLDSEMVRFLVAANYADHRSQCFVRLPFLNLVGRGFRLADRLGGAVCERSGDDLVARGLYLDLPAWGCHVFELKPAA